LIDDICTADGNEMIMPAASFFLHRTDYVKPGNSLSAAAIAKRITVM
jgi:hypothetical protein